MDFGCKAVRNLLYLKVSISRPRIASTIAAIFGEGILQASSETANCRGWPMVLKKVYRGFTLCIGYRV